MRTGLALTRDQALDESLAVAHLPMPCPTRCWRAHPSSDSRFSQRSRLLLPSRLESQLRSACPGSHRLNPAAGFAAFLGTRRGRARQGVREVSGRRDRSNVPLWQKSGELMGLGSEPSPGSRPRGRTDRSRLLMLAGALDSSPQSMCPGSSGSTAELKMCAKRSARK